MGFQDLNGGPVQIFPPFYSFTIAAFALVTGSEEIAGRVVSLLAGIALPVLVYAIARQMYGLTVARIAAFLVAVSPFLIATSANVMTESLYLALLFGAIVLALRLLATFDWRDAAALGIAFGLAYLTRPEGVVIGVAVIASVGVFLIRKSARRALQVTAVAYCALAILAVPYALFISRELGKPAFEATSGMNAAIATQILRGMTYDQAARGIDSAGQPVGAEVETDLRGFPQPRCGSGSRSHSRSRRTKRTTSFGLWYPNGF